MIATVFFLLYFLLPLIVIVVSVIGSLITKKVFVTPLVILLLFLILHLTNVFELGYSPILIYTLISLITAFVTFTVKDKRNKPQEKTL
jgi:hypothetical protein